MTSGINWALAARMGGALSRPGPAITPAEATVAVADMRLAAHRAIDYVADITGLTTAAELAAQRPIHIVDRPGFVRGNTQILATLLDDVAGEGWGPGQTIAIQAAAVLAALSARVLGQYDPFTPGSDGRVGRVFIVAPNLVRFERELDVDAADFRLWVALHEQTHTVQFAAAPWLAGHLAAKIRQLLEADDEVSVLSEASQLVRNVLRSLRDETEPAALPAVLSASQQGLLAEITATMSFLEGHADVIMDAAGPRVVRSVEAIRHRFDARRVAGGRLERTVRRIAGLDVKTAQYIQGAGFVRSVLAQVGHEGLAAVFAEPTNLPTTPEIDDPALWVTRVHG